MNKFPELPETHDIGMVSIENIDYLRGLLLQGGDAMLRADLGIQIATDGRAVLRFKPAMKGTLTGRVSSKAPNFSNEPKEW